ncbi:---NA---, partial [Paramuricea clavata]
MESYSDTFDLVVFNFLKECILLPQIHSLQCSFVVVENMAHYTLHESQKCTSEIRLRLAEVAKSLDLFDKYVESPSNKTAKTLKQSFDNSKSTYNELSADEIDEMLECTRTSLLKFIPDSDNENRKSKDSDHKSSNSVNKNVNLFDFQPDSISEDASKNEKEKTSIRSPNLKNENSFQSSSENKQQEEKQHFNTAQSKEHEKFEDLLMQSSQELKQKQKKVPTSKTKAKKFVGSDQDPSIGQPLVEERSKKVEMKIYTDVSSIDKEMDALKSLNCEHPKSLRKPEIEIHFLRKEIESLKIENQKILAEHGQILVEQTAKESEERKSDLFQRIFRSEAKQSVVSTTASSEQPAQGAEALQGGNHQRGKQETATRDKDESKIQGRDENSTGISTYRSNSENQNPTTQNSSSIASKEKTSGGEGIDTSGHVKGTGDAASTSRDENNTLQSYENLSFSVQQDVSNGTEYISLGNVPPTSVATTLYNNYKFLLLSLGQSLLSSDVVKLMDWASQNFSIENAQNATDVLLQLDQKRIINASDLSPLRDFFESIIRIDLAYIIDEFLLGNYSLLRQISALKTRDVNRAQNPQYGSTSRFTSFLKTLSSSRSYTQGSRTAGSNVAASGSLQMSTNRNPATSRTPENSNGPQSSLAQQNRQPALSSFLRYPNTNNTNLVSRSPNENQSKAHEQRNVKPIATGFTETSVVVADSPVT